MLDKELEELRRKHNENKEKAFRNIIALSEQVCDSELERVLKHFNIEGNIEAENIPLQIEEIKKKYDVSSRVVLLEGDWYKKNMLPILCFKGNEGKIILPDFMGRCFFFENGRKVRITAENSSMFSEQAICFYKGFNKDKIKRKDFIKYMLGCITPAEYGVVLAASVFVILFSMVIPEAQYYIFNNIIPSGTKSDILPLTSLLLGIIIISAVLYIFRSIITENIPSNINANIQGAVISRLLNIKAGYFADKRAGALSHNILNVSEISDIFSAGTITDALSFVLSVIYIAQMYLYSNEFMPYVYASLVIMLIMSFVNSKLLKKHTCNFNIKINNMSGFVYELFCGMENIKLSNAQSSMLKKWSEYYSDGLRAEKRPFFVRHFSAINTFVISCITLVLFYAGIKESISSADFIAFLAVFGLFIGSVKGTAEFLNKWADFSSLYVQLEDFFNAETETVSEKKDIKDFRGNIELSEVSFKYKDSDRYVINNISISISQGEKIGITGRSGCGKTTLLRLILGFEKPDSGRIFADNTDLNEINLKSYRKNLGVVLQSSKLITGDIFSNITLTNPMASEQEVWEIAEAVGLKDDIERMPMKLHTFVSDDSLTISQGQRQRILLARALINKPKFLILDEATNNLDNITQAAITDYIDKTKASAIIVAHRLSTIADCDRIIVLDRGTVSESGTYNELIDKKGMFYALVKNQKIK
ncbi:MAG: ATP-binding cassette domain-containing protein [Clostridia bacterium]|nr:ATP-binding cassette domain-containing protein [Clostridia bacterium]